MSIAVGPSLSISHHHHITSHQCLQRRHKSTTSRSTLRSRPRRRASRANTAVTSVSLMHHESFSRCHVHGDLFVRKGKGTPPPSSDPRRLPRNNIFSFRIMELTRNPFFLFLFSLGHGRHRSLEGGRVQARVQLLALH